MDQVKEKSGNFVATIATAFMITTALLGYITFELYANRVQLSKSEFICTKIEQIGKNMDDVRCTQYTLQKFSKEAIALNELIK